MIEIKRTHEICMGHRVYGHESKCSNLHGHNYIFEFTVRPKVGLDSIGRVVDFSEVKSILCEWLEINWDHKMMLFQEDSAAMLLRHGNEYNLEPLAIIEVPFNPTAENIAYHFLTVVAPSLTSCLNWYLYAIKLHETSKCSSYVSLEGEPERKIEIIEPLVPMPVFYYCDRQRGGLRFCECSGKTDEEKKACSHCHEDLPF